MKKKLEEDYQTKAMSVVALLKTRLSVLLVILLQFTNDAGWRRQKLRMKT